MTSRHRQALSVRHPFGTFRRAPPGYTPNTSGFPHPRVRTHTGREKGFTLRSPCLTSARAPNQARPSRHPKSCHDLMSTRRSACNGCGLPETCTRMFVVLVKPKVLTANIRTHRRPARFAALAPSSSREVAPNRSELSLFVSVTKTFCRIRTLASPCRCRASRRGPFLGLHARVSAQTIALHTLSPTLNRARTWRTLSPSRTCEHAGVSTRPAPSASTRLRVLP
jgi:hypothetical protein